MVAFRKLFLALAGMGLVVGSFSTVNAQVTGAPFTCQTSTGVPPLVRAEGFTELVGDIVLVCTGGNPASPFLANFRVFLNTNVTSRLLTSSLSEATLLIDEPLAPGRFTVPSPPANPNGLPSGKTTPLCVAGVDDPATCNPSANAAGETFQGGTSTAFRGTKPASGENSIDWAGVTITPPGSTSRVIRITNMRANAAGLGTSSTLIPTQIVALISVSGSQSIAINNPQQTVAFVQTGLRFDVRKCDDSDAVGSTGNFVQCTSQNADLFTDPTKTDQSAQMALRFREGFQTAFKTRIDAAQLQSLPGQVFNTESGYVRQGKAGLERVGEADHGTRLAARFNNVPAGTRIFVATTPSVRSSSTATASLIQTGVAGEGGTITGTGTIVPVSGTATIRCNLPAGTPGASQSAAEVTITSGTGLAVWEVTGGSSTATESLLFNVAVAFKANTPNNLPGLGQSTVTGNFAPFYGATSGAEKMSQGLPIPRFLDNPISTNDFRIDTCATNLLFPFVTNQAGFDTGIAIANTSRDPFANPNDRLQSGTCTMNYYGETTGGGAAPTAQKTTANLEAGKVLTFVLSSGGGLGIAGTPGFQGYIIAQCTFQYGHGFAFITDGPIGAARVAEGYLALVMDAGIGTRGTLSEVLSH